MKAFVYSLDAFIAVIIISMAINLLLFGLGASIYQYSVAYQLKLLSSDGIRAIASSQPVLDHITNGNSELRSSECASSIRQNLPPGYGYALLRYNISTGNWTDIEGCSQGDLNKAGIGVQSSDAVIVVSTHTVPSYADAYGNPYAYKTCNSEAGLVPCNLQNFTVDWGMETMALRLVVFI